MKEANKIRGRLSEVAKRELRQAATHCGICGGRFFDSEYRRRPGKHSAIHIDHIFSIHAWLVFREKWPLAQVVPNDWIFGPLMHRATQRLLTEPMYLGWYP